MVLFSNSDFKTQVLGPDRLGSNLSSFTFFFFFLSCVALDKLLSLSLYRNFTFENEYNHTHLIELLGELKMTMY